MLTTGFKLFYGIAIAALVSAAVLGYTSGGNHLGPLTLGYKGSVGFHFGYVVLVTAGFASGAVGLVLQAFRDGDAEAVAQVVGTEVAPVGQTPLNGSFWPLGAGFAVAVTLVGLILHPAIAVTGLALLAVVIFEWTMSAWSDRATGDPVANRELRDRIMRPIEIPVLAFGGVAVIVLAVSRILLTSSKLGAVIVATVVAALVFGVAVLLSARPKINKNVATAAVLIGAVGVLTAGIVSAVNGERDFEHHGEESHGAEASVDEGADGDESGTEGEASDE